MEVHGCVQEIVSITDSTERQFEIGILTSASSFDDDGRGRFRLIFPSEKLIDSLKTDLHGVIIDADVRLWVVLQELWLVDDDGDDGAVEIFHESAELRDESMPHCLVQENGEGVSWLSDFVLVENDLVMAPEFKFETLEGGADLIHIVCLTDDEEEQDKDWKLWINLGEMVISAFIDEYEMVAKGRRW